MIDLLMSHILSVMIILPLIGSIITALLAFKHEKVASIFAILISLIEMLLSVILILNFNPNTAEFQFQEIHPWLPQVGIYYHVGADGISIVMVLLCGIVCFISAWAAYYQIEHNKGFYYSVFLLFETGVIGTFVALNFVIFYLFWELVLVPMFFLIGEWGPIRERARYAAIKFFIFTHVGSVLMLLGFIYLYAVTGTFEFISVTELGIVGLSAISIAKDVQTIATALIFWGFAVKLPVVPLHTWLPLAHGEAPAPVSALLAGLLLKMGGYGFVRLVWLLPDGFYALVWPYFIPLAVFASIYSAFTAMMQRDLKYLVAFTSICHMSLVFFAAVAAAYARMFQELKDFAAMALAGAVLEMFAHGVVISLCFLMSGVTHHWAGTRDISKLSGLARKMPWSGVLWLFGAISAGALPPTVGFSAEITLFVGSINCLWNPWPWTALVLLSPVIVVAYFIWFIQRAYLGKLHPELEKVKEAPVSALLPEAALLIPILLFGIFPALISNLMTAAIYNMIG